MIGHNLLYLNKSEMLRALDYYLNNIQFKEPIEVTEVSERRSEHDFELRISEIYEDQEKL